MANTIVFDEGMNYLHQAGLPATCYFALSTKAVGTATAFTTEDTLAGGIGEITGTGYARGTVSRPTMSHATDAFTQLTWTTGTAVNWPADVRSLVMVTVASGTAGTAIAASNLQSGGAVRDMSAANTTEKATPTISFTSGN